MIGRVLPRRRIFIKTETRTRYLTISPLAQVASVMCVAALLGWTGYLSYQRFAAIELDTHLVGADAGDLTSIYERRIARLEDERRRLADDLSSARLTAADAGRRLGATAVSLSDARAEAQALAVAVASHQAQLNDLAAKKDDADLANALTAASLVEAEDALAALRLSEAETQSALADLAKALAETADQRDLAAKSAAALTSRVSALETAFAVKTDEQARLISRLEDAAELSLSSLEGVFAKSGVDVEDILANVRSDYSGEGGVFLPVSGVDGFAPAGEDPERLDALFADMERVNALRIAVGKLPFSRPVRAARFTSGFGPRRDPINGRRGFHGGIDLAAPRGTAIFATGDGEVVYSGWQRGYGKLIKIRHAFGYETVYGHLNRRRVNVGDKVERGDRIGDMGNTGRSTGTHLHYEIRVNGKTVNPAKYIEAARNVL